MSVATVLSPGERACRIFKRRHVDKIAGYLAGVASYRDQMADATIPVVRPINPYARDTAMAHAWAFGWEDAVSGIITSSTGVTTVRVFMAGAARVTVLAVAR